MIEDAEDRGALEPGQTVLEPTSGNTGIALAHYRGTAVEILETLDGHVTAFVAGLGTGGTLMGCGRRLKEVSPETLVVAAEPMQGDLVQGLRSLEYGFILPIIDLSLLNRKILVSNRDAVGWTKRLLTEEGLFAGVSAGAIAAIAVRVAKGLDGGNVVFVVPDGGWKYVSAGVYSKAIGELEADGTLERGAFW
jgi:[CysO sulfur-carrier protein]-thiocarboxylate-dependent cysteine synthase